MSLWSQPQPPQVIGPVNSTLPLPHDPIPAQGDQPPRRQVAFALMMAVAVAAWPADLEPRLQAPNNAQQKIAPLTLTYGQQPQPQAFLNAVELGQLVASWPLEYPSIQRSRVSAALLPPPPIPVPPQSFLSVAKLAHLVALWPADAALPPRGSQTGWFPSVITQVPAGRTGTIYPAILQANADDYEVELVSTFVQAPTNPDQPPIAGGLSVQEIAEIVNAWAESWPAQTFAKNAAWNVPPIQTAYVPPTEPAAHVYAASQPPDPLPVPRLQSVVPTFPAVSQPPVKGPQTPFIAVLAAWVDAPIMPRALPSAAWIASPLPFYLAPTVLPQAILAAWVETPLVRQPPVQIAPLTLTYGATPQPQSPLSVLELTQIVATWTQSWDAQTAPKNAGWNVPPILSAVAFAPLPRAIWTAWEPAWIQPPVPVAIVTLTLPTGTQPPPARAALERPVAAALAWTPDPPLPVTLRPTAGWNVPPVLVQVATVPLPWWIRTAWDEPFKLPQRLVTVAPLTLVYGQPPVPGPALSPTDLLTIASWPTDLEPRLSWPNASRSQTARENPFTIPNVIQVIREFVSKPTVTSQGCFVPTVKDEGVID